MRLDVDPIFIVFLQMIDRLESSAHLLANKLQRSFHFNLGTSFRGKKSFNRLRGRHSNVTFKSKYCMYSIPIIHLRMHALAHRVLEGEKSTGIHVEVKRVALGPRARG